MALDFAKIKETAISEATAEHNAPAPSPAQQPEPQQEFAPGESAEVPSSVFEEIEVPDLRYGSELKRKIKVDFNDKEALKKELVARYNYERGMRKMQAERDLLSKASKEQTEKLAKIEERWNSLDKAWKERGEEGIIDLLKGASGGYKQWLDSQLKRHDFLKNATDEERDTLEAKEKASRYEQQVAALRQENEEFKKSVEARSEALQVRELQSAFDRAQQQFGFGGKLDSAEDEALLDDMLFEKVREDFADREDITAELIAQEFKKQATRIKARMGLQAEKKTANILDAKKQHAAESVGAAIKTGYRPDEKLREEAGSLVRSGSIGALLRGFDRYKGVLGG